MKLYYDYEISQLNVSGGKIRAFRIERATNKAFSPRFVYIFVREKRRFKFGAIQKLCYAYKWS